jgi:glycosyltransferase involved in cell wall biosynthesis
MLPSLHPQQNRIRILFDASRLIRALGAGDANYGINKYTDRMLERLDSHQNIDVVPVYSAARDSSFSFLRAARYFRAFARYTGHQIHLTPGGLPFPLDSLHRAPLDQLRQIINTATGIFPNLLPPFKGPQVYFSTHSPLPPRDWLPARTPRIIVIHDVLHLKFPDLYQHDDVPQIKSIVNSIDPDNDYVVCDSATTQHDLFRFLPIPEYRTSVIHLAPDEIFHAHDENRCLALNLLPHWSLAPDRYILALAQLEKRKNIEALIHAYSSLNPVLRSNYPLVLILSQKRSEPQVRQWLADAAIPNANLRLLSDVSTETLAALLCCARLFVFPSLYEGFGIPLVEAMAAGCPILASNSSTHPEVLDDAGVMFDPADPNALADCLAALLNNPDRLAQCRARGLERAKQFSWAQTADQLQRFLRDCAEAHNMSATTR